MHNSVLSWHKVVNSSHFSSGWAFGRFRPCWFATLFGPPLLHFCRHRITGKVALRVLSEPRAVLWDAEVVRLAAIRDLRGSERRVNPHHLPFRAVDAEASGLQG